MILTSVKLCTSEAEAQNHEWESSCSFRVAYFIFSHACTEMATLLPKTREENSLFGVHTKNVSQKIRQKQFITNCRLSQRWSWLPILSSFRNEFTFWSVRWRHLMVQKWQKNHGANANHAIVPHMRELLITPAFFVCTPKRGFSSRVSGKKMAISVHAW